MSITIFHKKSYSIYKVNANSFIIHNHKKIFYCGHTHINNYDLAKRIINYSISNIVPSKGDHNIHTIESLIRLSLDNNYIESLKKEKDNIIKYRKERMNKHESNSN